MPRFGKTSSERLATCHKDLQTIFNEVIKSLDCSILCGHRGKKEQDKALVDGFSQVQYPHSKHNPYPSLAVDAAPYFTDLKNTDWSDALAFANFAGYVQAVANELLAKGLITHRIRWGGDWDCDGRTKDHSFIDLPHFELVKP